MKIKFFKIFGVALTVALLASLFGFAVPVSALPIQWAAETIPGAAGNVILASDVTDMAVASDGSIYAVDAQGNRFLKAAAGGRSFTDLTAGLAALYTAPARLVAVAPDNPNVVAIVDSLAAAAGVSAAGQVYLSTDGGVTWAALPLVPDTAAAANTVRDIAISPAVPGAALGRHYAVAVTADADADVTDGGLFILGPTLAFALVGGLAADTYDCTSVAFSPNYIGDRTIVGVGSLATDTFLLMYNTLVGAAVVADQVIETVISDSPDEFGDAGAGILSSDIALPSDFDPTIVTGRRVYVVWNQTAAGDSDVYRIDNISVYKLGIAADLDLHSVSYSGTVTSGYLVAGEAAVAGVAFVNAWYSDNPQTTAPVWAVSLKPPTGGGNCVVRVAPDFATTGTVYAGTIDGGAAPFESAFSASTDRGKSFNQRSLIDTVIDGLSDVMPTPDGTTVFLATWDNGTGSSDFDSLWKSSIPVSGTSWERVRISIVGGAAADWGDAAGTSIIRLNPDWATAPAVFWCNTAVAGAPQTDIQYSADGGAVFAARTTAPNAIQDLAVESKDIIYVATGASVIKSTNGGWWFAPAVDAALGANIYSLAMAPSYPLKPKAGHLLVGSVGAAVSYSTNGATSFTPIVLGLAGATNVQVVADTKYETNNIIYAGSGTANQGVYRWVIGTSTSWEQIRAPANAADIVRGMVATNAALYAAWDRGAAPTGVDRTLDGTCATGIMTWRQMDAGAALARFNSPPSSLRADATANPIFWAVNTVANTLFAYTDTLVTVKPAFSTPPDGFAVSIDPVTGRAENVTFAWSSMGTGTGQVNTFDFLLYEKPLGITAAAVTAGVAVIFPTAPQTDNIRLGAINAVWNNLRANTEYVVLVRAANEISLDAIVSPWSAGLTLKVQAGVPVQAPQVGPILLGPPSGVLDTLRPGFSWAPLQGVTSYQFILATDAALTKTVAGTPATVTAPSFSLTADLDYSTTYFWAVKATAPTTSPQSIGSFTTMAKPVPPTPPVVITPPTPAPPSVLTPAIVWGIIGIGAILVIVVLVLIVRTRRPV